MANIRKLLMALVSASVITLAGCEAPPHTPSPVSPPPILRPASPKPVAAPQSEVSRKMSEHLSRLQADLLVRGLLRVDGGGPDVPFSKRKDRKSVV